MKTRLSSQVLAAAWCAVITTVMLRAQDFTLDWSAVTSGGGQSSAGDFSIDATISQADAGGMSGGDFHVEAGFWSIITTLDVPGAPTLSFAVTGNEVLLSWPASSGNGFGLEEASAFAASPVTTSWTAVSATPQQTNGLISVRLPLASGNRFYRLHKL
jgi:hypothetical protein